MVRKKQQKPELEQIELPIELPVNSELPQQAEEMKVVSPIRGQVRLMPDIEWGALVTEMHDYISAHHDLINASLQKNAEIATKFVLSKKPSRGAAQTKSGVVLRDDIPAQPTPTQETVKQESFPRHRRIKRNP